MRNRIADTFASTRVTRMRVFATGAIRRFCVYAHLRLRIVAPAAQRPTGVSRRSASLRSTIRSLMTPNTSRTIHAHSFANRIAKMTLKSKHQTKGISFYLAPISRTLHALILDMPLVVERWEKEKEGRKRERWEAYGKTGGRGASKR